MRTPRPLLLAGALAALHLAACTDDLVRPRGARSRPLLTPGTTPTVSTTGVAMLDLGTLSGGDYSIAYGAGPSGEVVGQSWTSTGYAYAFVWTAAAGMQQLPSTGYTGSFARAVDPNGDIVGGVVTAAGHFRAVRWTAAGVHLLGQLPGGLHSIANAAGPFDVAVGQADVASGDYHAAIWSGGGIADLGTLGGARSVARGTRNVGLNEDIVVGEAENAAGQTRAFQWAYWTGMVDLGALPADPGGNSSARAIASNGDVVGYSGHAFLWSAQTQAMQDLGALPGGSTSAALAIGPSGEVVGQSDVGGGVFHAFRWTAAGGMADLGTLPGGDRSIAEGVGPSGEVVGTSYFPDGTYHAVVWLTNAAPNSPPTASAAAAPTTLFEGSAVAFTGTASDPDGDPLTYAWDFGDGTAGSGLTPSHVYADNGAYTATLTVSDGTSSATAAVAVTVLNAGPVVHAGQDRLVFTGNLLWRAQSFTDPGVNDNPWSWMVDFGDGSMKVAGTANMPESVPQGHTYTTPGVYLATYTVTDKDGDTRLDSAWITVIDVPRRWASTAVDILPGQSPNALTFAQLDLVPVAVLSAPGMDATRITLSSVWLGVSAGMVPPLVTASGCGGPCTTVADVNGDGLPDLLLHFDLRDLYPGGIGTTVTPTLTLLATNRGLLLRGTNPLRITP